MNEVMKTSGSRLRNVATWSGYGLFFVTALTVSLLLTFPNRQLKSYVEARARTAGYPLRIGEMRVTGLIGVHLSDVDLTLPAQKRKKAKNKNAPTPPPREPTVLHFDDMRLDAGLFAAIDKEVDLHFEFEVGEGHLSGGHLRVAGKKIDLEIEEIDNVSLEQLGVGRRALAFQDKLSGELDGQLSGNVKVHWGGTHEDFTGKLDVELSDAVLRSPRLEIQGGLAMSDMVMGLLSATVNIDQMGKIKILKGQSARDKSTAVSLESVDIFGRDLELVVEERSHIYIPPGKAGMRGARMQIHFAFALPLPKASGGDKGDEGDEEANDEEANDKEAEEPSSRLKWSAVMKLAGDKLKPFQRSGYIGMTCTGALSRPKCLPALPQVTVGTRRKARTDARARKKQGDEAAKPDPAIAAAAKKKADEEAAKKKLAEAAKKKADEEAAKKKLAEAAAKKKAEDERKRAAAKVELKTVQDRAGDRLPERVDDGPERGGDERGRGEGIDDDADQPRDLDRARGRGEGRDEDGDEDEDEDGDERPTKRGKDREGGDEEEAEGDQDEADPPKTSADEEDEEEERPRKIRGRRR